jgi:enterobactin synthetase component D
MLRVIEPTTSVTTGAAPLRFVTAAEQPMLAKVLARCPNFEERFTRMAHPLPTRLGQHVGQVALSLAKLGQQLEQLDLDAIAPEVRGHVARRQLAFIGGRLCAELSMIQLGSQPQRIGRGTAGEPTWPDAWIGSIAHNDDFALAVVAPSAAHVSIGVDTEHIVDRASFDAVGSICLSPAENSAVREAQDPCLAATLMFSAKEAYYKAGYPRVRRYVDFLDMQIDSIDFLQGTFDISPSVPAAPLARGLTATSGVFAVRDHCLTTWICLR